MSKFKNISIREKLIIIQLATAFIAVLICCSIFVYNNVHVFTETSIASKNSIAEIVGINAASSLEFEDRDAAREMLQKLKSNTSILNAVILDKNGKEFARYDKKGEGYFSFSNPVKNETKEQNDLARRFVVNYRIGGKDFLGTVMMRAEISGFRDIIISYLKIAFGILLASLFAAFVISTLLQRSITKRLLSLVHKTKEVTETGNYSIRVSSSGYDEIGSLSGAFNNMLAQIEEQNRAILSFNQNLEQRVEQRTIELELANKELGAFSYSVSHDLRAPIRAVSGYAGILLEEYGQVLDNEGKRLLGEVVRNAEKMGTLIDDLLAFSQLGRKEVKKSQVDMDDLTSLVLSELNSSVKHHATITVGALRTIMGDRALIKQVLTNLLSNAIKYSSKKPEPVVEIKLKQEDGQMIYSVSDNGAGFDMQYANKLFGVFQRLHTEKEFPGTGVGLAIVERIIGKHGGRVWAEGKLGAGATFYFSLPIIDPS
ncbi:MAG: hypothetical protein JWO06_3947 [Bacteroidota bacterium]|nr:hypothetical protein [Bacteroidota bacterium]